jgi:hypothetical protein
MNWINNVVVLVSLLLFGFGGGLVRAQTVEDLQTKWIRNFSIGLGSEVLIYKEHEPDTFTESRVTVVNPVINAAVNSRYGFWVFGFKGVYPVCPTESIEKWDSYGIRSFQTNVFKYEWSRADAYLGYFIDPGDNQLEGTVYLGIRRSLEKQTRSDFIQQGVRLVGRSTEEVEAYGLLIGVMGNNVQSTENKSRWIWTYALEYMAPLSVKTANNRYPAMEFDDKRGYTYQLRIGRDYKSQNHWILGGEIYGGLMHWQGSGWQLTPYGRLKWPDNDTQYLGVSLHAGYLF